MADENSVSWGLIEGILFVKVVDASVERRVGGAWYSQEVESVQVVQDHLISRVLALKSGVGDHNEGRRTWQGQFFCEATRTNFAFEMPEETLLSSVV